MRTLTAMTVAAGVLAGGLAVPVASVAAPAAPETVLQHSDSLITQVATKKKVKRMSSKKSRMMNSGGGGMSGGSGGGSQSGDY